SDKSIDGETAKLKIEALKKEMEEIENKIQELKGNKAYEERISRNKELYLVIKESFKLVEETFDIIISDMEYANILDIFESQYDTDKFKS
ncbi:putative transcription antiterminator domain protein, partial [Clostridioides difficile Y184]